MKNNLLKKPIVVDWSLRLAVFIAAVGVWELFVGTAQNFLLPRFTEVAKGLFYLLFSESRFWEALHISHYRHSVGSARRTIPLDGSRSQSLCRRAVDHAGGAADPDRDHRVGVG